MNTCISGRENLPGDTSNKYSDPLHNEDPVHMSYLLYGWVEPHHDDVSDHGCFDVASVGMSKEAQESLSDSCPRRR